MNDAEQKAGQSVQGDDWLYDVLSKLESDIYNNIKNARNSLRAIARTQTAIQAQVDEAVREARKEERRLLQRELDSLQQFQKSVINREALRTGPIVVCAGCAKQLTTQPKPSKEGSHDRAE